MSALHTRLLDGTVIVASGEKNILRDPIQQTIAVNGQEVMFDAVGVPATRLDSDILVAAATPLRMP